VSAAPEPLPTARVAALEQDAAAERWLVRSLWSEQAVGFIGGAPKSCKSWLGLELAVAVASNTPCLGRFEVDQPGPVLVYLAEDSLGQLRRRVEGLCRARRLSLGALDLHVVTAPSLRLDVEADQARLDATLTALRPKLVLLDPLVRMHRLDENSSADISGLLGLLRQMQRQHATAIVLVHHMSKRSRAQPGQALRGSSDLHAWSDSAAYLGRRRDRLRLTLEHRCAPAPEPLTLELCGGDDDARLEVSDDNDEHDAPDREPPPTPLADEVRRLLADAAEPMARVAIRRALRVNNHRLGQALLRLEHDGVAERAAGGWRLATTVPA